MAHYNWEQENAALVAKLKAAGAPAYASEHKADANRRAGAPSSIETAGWFAFSLIGALIMLPFILGGVMIAVAVATGVAGAAGGLTLAWPVLVCSIGFVVWLIARA